MKTDYRSFIPNGSESQVHFFQINEQVGLHVISYTPETSAGNDPVVLVGGLATIPESLRKIISELNKDFPLFYVETREKTGSEIRGKVNYDIETMGLDLVEILKRLQLKDGRFILMGYSLGATVIADCYRYLEAKPRSVVFMEPTPVFHYPDWSLPLIRFLGIPLYKLLIPVAKWYLRKFRINTLEDAEMAVISFRALDHAEPHKLRSVILAIARYTVWERLKEINCPVLIVGASKDHLHIGEEIKRMISMLKKCNYVDMETNFRTHSAETGKVIRNFYHQLLVS